MITDLSVFYNPQKYNWFQIMNITKYPMIYEINKKIKKWLNGPILYDEYMNNANLNIKDLNEEELNSIKEKLNILIKYYKIANVTEEDKLRHIKKEINILNWYNKNDFFPELTEDELYKINHGGNIPNTCIYIKNLSYSDKMQKCLLFYFMNINLLKGKYNNYFYDYLRNFLRFYNINPTKNELNRFLNGKIYFNEIRDMWQEFEESNKTDEDYNRIILNGLILTDEKEIN